MIVDMGIVWSIFLFSSNCSFMPRVIVNYDIVMLASDDAPPSSLLDPKKIQLCQRAEVIGTWCRSQLPALKRVRGAC